MAAKHQKVAIVTGGSSGIGRCTAAALRNKGYTVYEFSRRDIPINGVKHLSVDVTDEKMVESAIHQIMKNESKIDAVINCAGFGISGAVEFTTTEQAIRAAAILSISAQWQPQRTFLFRPSTQQAKLPFHPILMHLQMKSDHMASMSQQ